MVRKLQVLRSYIVIQFFIVLATEWELPAKKCVQEDTESPDVGRWARVFDLAHDLWCHIAWRPAENLDFPLMWDAGTKPKVDHFDPLFRLIEQYVLQLDVTMGYIALMTVMNCLNDLAPEEFSLEFWHLPVWLHFKIAVQTATIDELHDQKNLLV